jgi:Uma2 family endonuclease
MTIQEKAANGGMAGRAGISYEEFLRTWRDERAEWVDGEVVVMAPVSSQHQFVSLFLVRLLSEYVEHHGLGSVFFEDFNMKTPARPSGRNLDVMFVSTAHRDRIKSNHLDGPADLAIEIVSPDDPDRDRLDKFIEYERGGVGEYWLIDPLQQRAEFFRLGSAGRFEALAVSDEGILRSDVVTGFWIRVHWLWDRPPLHGLRVELGLP